jgi:ribosome-associated protein
LSTAPDGYGPAVTTSGLRVTRTCVIPLSELQWRFSGASGPGGQHVNTANTRVEVRFDVMASRALGGAERARLVERFGPVVRVVASDTRSQARNRELALGRLRARLAEALRRPSPPRRPTRPTAGARRARVEQKRRRGEIKRRRRPPRMEE